MSTAEATTTKTGASLNRGKSKQDYGTPMEFIRAVEDRFGALVAPLPGLLEELEQRARAPVVARHHRPREREQLPTVLVPLAHHAPPFVV